MVLKYYKLMIDLLLLCSHVLCWPLVAKHFCHSSGLSRCVSQLSSLSLLYDCGSFLRLMGHPIRSLCALCTYGGPNPLIFPWLIVLVHAPLALPSTSVGSTFQLLPFWLINYRSDSVLLLTQCSSTSCSTMFNFLLLELAL